MARVKIPTLDNEPDEGLDFDSFADVLAGRLAGEYAEDPRIEKRGRKPILYPILATPK